VLPVEQVAGVAGELLEEGALGPAVAFAERVDGVDLAEVAGQPLGERTPGQAAQEALPVQSTEDLCCGGLDVLRQAEPGPRCNGSSPELSGPVVDVTEDALAGRAQVT
jgi:hypothetical protein